MATSRVLVTVVDVGQGQCTFVEIYDDSLAKPLIHTLLFDCGTNKRSSGIPNNITYIATKVSEMAVPTFDCIFFSHSDTDHTSLIISVLSEFTVKPVIKKVWYGGAWANYDKIIRRKPKLKIFNILDYLEAYAKPVIRILGRPSNSTDYLRSSRDFQRSPLWTSDDREVAINCVVCNVMKASPSWNTKSDQRDVYKRTSRSSAILNMVSMVCGIYYRGKSMIICGDATNGTMAAFNNLYTSPKTSVFKNNKMTTMPHHGSRTSTLRSSGTEAAARRPLLVVQTFSALLESKTITVSAYEDHSHPSLEVMNLFLPETKQPIIKDNRLSATQNLHRIVANIDINVTNGKKMPVTKINHSFNSRTCTFSTHYSTDVVSFGYNLGETLVSSALQAAVPINTFACWQYQMFPASPCLLAGYADLRLPLVSFTTQTATPGFAKAAHVNLQPRAAKKTPGFLNRLTQFR